MDSKRKPWDYPAGTKVKRVSGSTWTIWSKMPIAPLWQVVALQCGIDPDAAVPNSLEFRSHDQVESAEWFYRQRLNLALSHVKAGTLPLFSKHEILWRSELKLADYATWAKSMGAGHELPPQFPQERMNASSSIQSHKWPWGSYETKLLRDLAAVGERWRLKDEGGTYVPGDDSTAPKSKDDIIPWLMNEREVSKDAALIIARMLHDQNVANGPRKRKVKKEE